MLPATKVFYDELVDLSNGIELQNNNTALLENTQTHLADYKQKLREIIDEGPCTTNDKHNGSILHSMEANLIE